MTFPRPRSLSLYRSTSKTRCPAMTPVNVLVAALLLPFPYFLIIPHKMCGLFFTQTLNLAILPLMAWHILDLRTINFQQSLNSSEPLGNILVFAQKTIMWFGRREISRSPGLLQKFPLTPLTLSIP